MVKRILWALAMGSLIAVGFGACAPQTRPTPVTPAPQPVTAPQPLRPAPEPVKAPTAWDRVVESAQKEGRITVYSFNYVGELGIAMASAFQNRYGIKVDIITGRGAEFIERLKTEKRIGAMVADLSEGSSVHMMNMKDSGVTVAVPDLPVLQEKDAWLVHPLSTDAEAHVLNYFPTVWGTWVNTKLVKPGEEPQSLFDLLKPGWKGKLAHHDPNTSSSAYLYYVPLVNAKVIDWEYVKALGKQDLRLAPGPVQVADLINRDQVSLAINTDSTMNFFVAEGVPIKPLAFKEGEVASLGGAVVIKAAPHPNAARVFMNWLLTDEGQTVYMKYKNLFSVRKGGPDFRPAAARVAYKRLIPSTAKDYDEGARLMRERFLVEMWKK